MDQKDRQLLELLLRSSRLFMKDAVAVASCSGDAPTSTLSRSKNAGTLGAYAETSLTYLELKTTSRYLPGGTNRKSVSGPLSLFE
jgi:hypothetical protein